ncbi:MAG TPA: cation diffusion facilitator family transporter [Candidatus Mediterraneibacter excrementavium]|nr:cation diffusion facilitator family transporter [Candidatus Mediterraneibacter excrementavium]
MTEFLIRYFVKDYKETEKISVRTAYGVLASIVGILCNVFLFAAKFVIGLVVHSVSVTADAFNNLSDAGSSIISFVGVKMAEKPADKDHPFGHGRIEYIAALVVSFLVLEVGFTFLKDSIGRIRTPESLNFQAVSVAVLILSVAVKLWLGLFNRKLGEKIDSKVMMAVFTDSMGDVITTSATILSLIFFAATGINIDGFVGAGVALVVMWAGVGIARDTLEPLIGQAIDPEVYEQIKHFVERYDGIEGTHDLIVHNYGPGRSMASIHAEVPNDVDIEQSHEIIDRIEREAAKELGLFLVIHMDPVETKDENVLAVREDAVEFLKELDPACTLHDFRVVHGEKQINLIFDMVVPIDYNDEKKEELKKQLAERLKKKDARYECVITVESDFVARADEETKQE